MEPAKQILVSSVIGFLHDELNSPNLSEERKESIEVAIQCLETAFEVENLTHKEKVDLLSLINYKPKVEVTEETKIQAEVHKNKGNDFMKNSDYDQAAVEYTKAIELNPNNAVYYCNRAAAYTRLLKDNDAIVDCNQAIKLDPTYGKAYGRLGIAYSNLNKYDLALKAYQTALKYDPNNGMYETNLKVAEERLRANAESGGAPSGNRQMPDISQFLNNPNVINVANQILHDPNFFNLMSGMVNMSGAGGDANTSGEQPSAVQAILQAGEALHRVISEDPNFYNNIASNINVRRAQGTQENTNTTDSPSESGDHPPEKEHKDQGSA
ncbi:small glutamine-rich tetratricopeptide repeat-containing protein alpha-like [Sitophilus oryzae]|uniref:Small glutamine-rich tetratricopeptide repeat-containing protein alpha-like n=1 Tax=Sitophilus oryzae TaxID=7048 RepID=A0A6J2YG21_SITOR|nr:small glutamine-rich tetratricopeptide repeat-containing protein alpha-like [Sitophilus oryzae]